MFRRPPVPVCVILDCIRSLPVEYDYNDSGDMDVKELRLAAKSVGEFLQRTAG